MQELLDGNGPVSVYDFPDECQMESMESVLGVPARFRFRSRSRLPFPKQGLTHGIYKLYYYYKRWERYKIKYYDTGSKRFVDAPKDSRLTKVLITPELKTLGIGLKFLVNAWKFENE